MPAISSVVSYEVKVTIEALATLLQASTGRVMEILTDSYVKNLPESEMRLIRDLRRAAMARLSSGKRAEGTDSSASAATYQFSRLCFKRDVIEPLGPQDSFRIETPVGNFQMTKSDFYRSFPNVAKSRSYLEGGIYHYRVLPGHAEEFRVANS